MATETRTRILNPVSEWTAPEVEMVSRLQDFRGKTIGLLDNGKPNNDIFQARLKELLQDLYPDTTIYAPGRPNQTVYKTPQQTAESFRDDFIAHGCDAVVVSISD
jgi:hypothetical protein